MNNKLPLMDGHFEQEGRHPIMAAFIILFCIGALYTFIGQIVVNIFVVLDTVLNPDAVASDGGLIEKYHFFYTRHKYLFLAITAIFQYTIILGAALQIIKKWHTKDLKSYLQYSSFPLLAIPLTLTGVVAIIPLVLGINQIYTNLFPVMKELESASDPLFSVSTPGDLVLVFFVICITPAICEEALFRGYFQKTLQRKWKFPIPILVAGFIFALYHQSPMGIPALTLVGVFLGLLYQVFGSLWVPMIAHLVYNSLIIALNNLPEDTLPFLFNSSGNISPPVLLISLAVFTGICTLMLIAFPQHRKQETETIGPEKEKEETQVKENFI